MLDVKVFILVVLRRLKLIVKKKYIVKILYMYLVCVNKLNLRYCNNFIFDLIIYIFFNLIWMD